MFMIGKNWIMLPEIQYLMRSRRTVRVVTLCMASLALVICLSSCSSKEIYETSTVVLDEGAENFLTISVKEIDGRKGIFTLKNCCEKKVTYGDRNYLEKYIDGEWMGLVKYNQRAMTEPSYDLWPDESIEYETEWGVLEEGEYRYVLPFTVIEGEDTRQSYCIAALFTI